MKKLFVITASIALCFGLFATPGVSPITPQAAAAAAPLVQNEDLDFTLVNATGYDIKALYIGATGTGDWAAEDEILKGRKLFKNGQSMPLVFKPTTKAKKWDIMVEWADGSGRVEWIGFDLTQINKITLHYNADTDKTTATID